MERIYLAKKGNDTLFFIAVTIGIVLVLTITFQGWNKYAFIIGGFGLLLLYTFFDYWNYIYIENDKIVFRKNFILKKQIAIPLSNIEKCVIHYRESPRGDSTWIYFQDFNNEVGCFTLPSFSITSPFTEGEYLNIENVLKKYKINYIRVYFNCNTISKKYKEENGK
ncbi:MAG: hypothetical protein ABI851_14795 [Saprospiraceae bacterium]